MRLLNYSTRALESFDGGHVPPYAILFHMWGDAEIGFQELIKRSHKTKRRNSKLKFMIGQARRDGIEHLWLDMCCIDKTSSAELSESILSAFSWYNRASKCYVCLGDVSTQQTVDNSERAWESSFRASRWFTRVWTLQELLAPKIVEFYSREGILLGTKESLIQLIHEITDIPMTALQGAPLNQFTVKERLRWAADRQCTKIEDQAYSLIGLFDVSMPLLYGEGDHAMARLLREINHQYGTNLAGPPFLDDRSLSRGRSRQKLPDDGFYSRLDNGDLRLLQLDSGALGEAITGQMHHHKASKSPPYYALSYVWGHEPKLHQVTINGSKRDIQPNLFHALQRFKSRGQNTIWVDALCINQDNEPERSTQVRQISQIYSGAEGVLIWLGEEDSSSRYAFDFLSEIKSDHFRWDGHWWDKNGFVALSRLLERPWFRRVWVIQEAAFSKHSVVLCGDREIYMDHLITHVRTLRDRSSAVPRSINHILTQFQDSPALRLINTITSALKGSTKGKSSHRMLPLEALVDLSIYTETTDVRDAIYALLNLASDIGSVDETCQSTTIVPDYTKSAIDVFGDFIAHCCSRSGSLDVICRPWAPILSGMSHNADQDVYTGERDQKLPSWIVSRENLVYGDPSKQFAQRVCGTSLTGHSRIRQYNAHYGRKPIMSLSARGIRDKVLTVRGILLGQIVRRSVRMADAILTRECVDILRTASHLEDETDPNDIPDIVWRTLCADSDGNGRRAPLMYGMVMTDLLSRPDSAAPGVTSILDSMTSIDPEEILGQNLPPLVEQFVTIVRDILWNRRTFSLQMTSDDKVLVGLIPRHAKLGDHVGILYGCSVPVVLRELDKVDGMPHWQLIGEAYVHGIMDGEVISSSSSIRDSEVDFIIE